MTSKRTFKRGKIYWVDFSKLKGDDASSGSEINGKKRPALVISNNWYNEEYKRVSVLVMSSKVKNIRHFEAYLGKVVTNDPKKRESKAMCDQIRSIDKRKLKEKGGKLTADQMEEIEIMLMKFLVLSRF